MDVSIPAPGGKVGLKTFGVYSVGAAGGIALYSNFVSQYVPDSWENWRVGPVTGLLLFFGASAIVGAALAAKAADMISK